MKSKNRKQFCKFISLLLVIALLCPIFTNIMPISAYAAETNEQNEYAAKVDLPSADLAPLVPLSEVPNFISQEQVEERGHISRLTDEENLNSVVYLNRDGTKTKYITDYPVKYVDSDGNTKFVDLSLVESNNKFQTAANDILLSISKDYTDGIALSYKEHSVSLVALPDVNFANSGTIITAPITIATKNNNAVTYNDVFGVGVDIKYSPLHNGVKEDIILHSYNGVDAFDFLLNTGGLGVYSEDNGYYLAETANADMRMDLGKVIVYDANFKISEGSLLITTLKENQLYQLTVSVDKEFLTDPNTVYPVQIDPSITISDTTRGANAVIDSPIYSGKPTVNMGTALYNPIGYLDSAYQTGRTAVKLIGLAADPAYQERESSSEILSAYFYIKDSSGTTPKTVNVHALIGISSWTETSLTWSQTTGCISSTVQASANVGGGAWSSFDITNLVRAWKSGDYNINCGFVLQSANESTAGNFFSSESAEANWPYLVYNYTDGTSSVTLSTYSMTIAEGGTRTLVATTNPSGQSIIWSSSNNSIASVNSSGVVTTHKAGTVTITASMIDPDGLTKSASCTVYVYIPDGVYYIKNLNSNYYLHVKNGGVTNYTDVYQYGKYDSNIANVYKIRQMWKVDHLGSGRYSIRPMSKPDMGLDVTSNNVDIYNIGANDTLSDVPSYAEWTIEWYSTGYIFKNNGNSSYTMQIEGHSTASGATVIASTFSTSTNCRWDLEEISSPPSGAYWYNTSNKFASQAITNPVCINSGESVNISNLNLVPVVYSSAFNHQMFNWSINNPAIATVHSDGTITALAPGNATITATSSFGNYSLPLNIQITSTDPFHSSNIQYMRNTRIVGKNWWGLGSTSDVTISIVKSALYSSDYCVIHNNVNQAHAEMYISNEFKDALNNLENGYQNNYNPIPLFNNATRQEKAAHYAKGETDQLVEAGYFAQNSSEYYGAWAIHYGYELDLINAGLDAINTASAAYGVYLSLTSFYYSYMISTSTTTGYISSTQYQKMTSIIDDIDDAMSGMNYSNKKYVSSDSRNTALAQQGYTDPLPYEPITPVVQYQQTSSTQYVRVFTTGSNGNKIGRWLMKYSDIQGLTPAQIQSKFALSAPPTHYCYVTVPSGTTVYVGVVNQSSVSGTLQYELATILSESYYGTNILLP